MEENENVKHPEKPISLFDAFKKTFLSEILISDQSFVRATANEGKSNYDKNSEIPHFSFEDRKQLNV